jgi:hypothetical protein
MAPSAPVAADRAALDERLARHLAAALVAEVRRSEEVARGLSHSSERTRQNSPEGVFARADDLSKAGDVQKTAKTPANPTSRSAT